MKTLPDTVSPYKRTALFTSDTIPAGFLREHKTPEGVWGVLNITKGSLIFCINDTSEKIQLEQSGQVVIAPRMKHHLELNGYAEFYVEFYN